MTQKEKLPPLVIVSGMPASGKSTLAQLLADRLHVPLLAKDAVKESLTRVAGLPADRAESQALGRRTMTALHELCDAHLDRGIGHVLECNFRIGFEADLRQHLLRADGVNVHCAVDGVAIERYRARAGSRHGAHVEDAVLAEARPDVWAAVHGPLDLGVPVLEVDTTDGYEPSLDAIIEWVEEGIRR